MNNLSGFNTQEMRRLHPYLSTLLRRLKELEVKVEAGTKIVWGRDEDVLPTGNENLAGILNKFARADHQHLFKFPVAVPLATPDGTAFFDLSTSAINIYVDDTPTTRVVAGGTDDDVRATKRRDAGTAPRYAFADHSHPTAVLPKDDPQPPTIDEIRYDENDKLVRWDGDDWVPLSVETANREAGTDDDVQPTKTRSAGSSLRFARADHSHPTAILPQADAQTPEIDEIRYNADDKLVRWDGSSWVPLSVETGGAEAGTNDDVQPTRLRDAGSSTRYARADHSHPTAILLQSHAQTPVEGEIRVSADDKLVRWDGTEWVEVSVERVEAGVDADVRPTKRLSAGSAPRFARADHSHPTAILPQGDTQTPEADEIRYTADDKLVRWNATVGEWVPLSVETFTVEWGNDVEPTRLRSAGSSARFARADHSHPTALLPQDDTQTPVVNEIRFNTDDKVVRWNGTDWVPLSVETLSDIEWGTDDDVQGTGLRNAGASTRFARADHSHPTVILYESDDQPPVLNEIRYDSDLKLIRWNGSSWVPLSVETVLEGRIIDVRPTGLREIGSTEFRFARADHSHPTALLPQSHPQTPEDDEIRYTATNRIVRWNGSEWVNLAGALPVPADPLVLPTDNQVSSPQNRQLVNHNSWDNIGHATIFYYDSSWNSYRLVFARPLVVATASTPSGKNFWVSRANELVLKYQAGDPSGASGVLWSRGGGSSVWAPVATQLVDTAINYLPTDVGVLGRSALTGTSGSRRWFLRGAQEDGSFRAPFTGIATFTSATTPSPANLSTTLGDGYGYFVHDIDRVDFVKPTTNGNKHPVMLPHYIIAPVCRTFTTTADPSGHYVRDEQWNSIWVVAFRTTTSATTNLVAILPTVVVPYGVQAGRVLLYLHNPQSSTISTIFALLVRTITSTGISDALTSDATVSIPANTTVVVDLGHLSFPASNTLSHHRSYPITPIIVRRRANETANSNAVFCFAVVIVPQREA